MEARLVQPQRRQFLRHRPIQPGSGGPPRRPQRRSRLHDTPRARVPHRLLQRDHLRGTRYPARPAARTAYRAAPAAPPPRPRACAPPRAARTAAPPPVPAGADRPPPRPASRVRQALRLGQRLLGALQCSERRRCRIGRIRLCRRDQPLQRPAGRAQRRRGRGTAPITRRQLGQRRGDRLGAPLALLQSLAFLREPFLLARLRRQTGQFVDRVAQPRPHHVPPRRSPRAPLPVPRSRPRQSRHAAAVGIAQRPRHAERVEQRGVACRIGQADLLVLALHLHQQRAGPPQQRHADRLVVDEGARAAVPAPARGAARPRPPHPAPAPRAARAADVPPAARSRR